MKNISLLLLAVVLMTACRKESTFLYHATPNVYFDLSLANAQDSLLYTFAYHSEKLTDTVFVPLRVSGERGGTSRRFVVKVLDTVTTTAVPTLHYEPLKSEYMMPADRGVAWLPVIVYNTDTNMVKRSFGITLRIEATDELGADLRQLTTTRVVFSNRLEKPFWWDMWVGGSYSQVKHQLYRLSATTNELTLDPINAPQYLFYLDQFKAMLASPATWVKNNPGKGYELTPRSDGNYDFYPIATPYKVIPYVKNTSTGLFYFIDETGNEVK